MENEGAGPGGITETSVKAVQQWAMLGTQVRVVAGVVVRILRLYSKLEI